MRALYEKNEEDSEGKNASEREGCQNFKMDEGKMREMERFGKKEFLKEKDYFQKIRICVARYSF